METATKLTGEERQRFMAEFARKHPPETIVATLRQVKAELRLIEEIHKKLGVDKDGLTKSGAEFLKKHDAEFLGYEIVSLEIDNTGHRTLTPQDHGSLPRRQELREVFRADGIYGTPSIWLIRDGGTPAEVGKTISEAALARLSK